MWDAHYYHFGATRIMNGLGYSEDVVIGGVNVWKAWCHYPVGYSGLLGITYKLFGNGLWVGPLLNALLGAATAVCVYALARHFLTPLRAKLAGVICAAHPGLIAYTALLMTEPLSALTLVVAGWLALWGRANLRGPIASGVALGLGTLVRPTALLAIPWLLPAFFRGFAWPKLRRALLAVGTTAVVTLAVVAPWTLRNCLVMDGCALVSTNGGWNLAIGALTETGRFTALKAEWGCPGPGQVQQDRCWGRVARKKIAEDPAGWLAKMPSKLKHTYNHESFAVGYLGEADPQTWTERRKNWWRTLTTVFHHLLMLAATLSAVSLSLPPGKRWSDWRTRLGAVVGLKRRTPPAEPTRRTYGAWAVQVGLLMAIAGYVAYTLQQPESALYWLIVIAPLVALARLPGSPALGAAGIYAWGLVLMTTVTHAVFFGDDRYHLTVSPVLCMLAAGALRSPTAAQKLSSR